MGPRIAEKSVNELLGLPVESLDALDLEGLDPDAIRDAIWERARQKYEEKTADIETKLLRQVERDVMLQIVDSQWKDHLYSLDHLKDGIGLRGYGQRDPLVEYKRESFALFQAMKTRIDDDTVKYLWRLRPVLRDADAPPIARRPAIRPAAPLTLNDPREAVPAFAGAAAATAGGGPRPARIGGDDAKVRTVRRNTPKVGRNDPCPCGSGKKYKKCHGA